MKDILMGMLCAILPMGVCILYLSIKLRQLKYILQQEQEEKRLAQLHFLNLQTKPHFLTNCLSIIYSLTLEHENELALRMISYLSKEMQYRFAVKGSYVTIHEELERVENYLNILQIRYPDAIDVEVHMDNRMMNHYISPFSLHPLVDNCIKHGRIQGKKIHIVISGCLKENAHQKQLVFVVADDGRGVSPEALSFLNAEPPRQWKLKLHRVGIENLKFRLQLLYGSGNTTLQFRQIKPHGTVVTMTLPDKTEKPLSQEDEDEQTIVCG